MPWHRNRWFTVLKNGWIFHGYGTNNQRVSHSGHWKVVESYTRKNAQLRKQHKKKHSHDEKTEAQSERQLCCRVRYLSPERCVQAETDLGVSTF